MTDAEREQMIRTSEPSENEQFLLRLLDKAREALVMPDEEPAIDRYLNNLRRMNPSPRLMAAIEAAERAKAKES